MTIQDVPENTKGFIVATLLKSATTYKIFIEIRMRSAIITIQVEWPKNEI